MDNKSFDHKSVTSRDSPISTSFNMKLDFNNESLLSMEKHLKSTNCQNYINLLNDPNPQVIFYPLFSSILYLMIYPANLHLSIYTLIRVETKMTATWRNLVDLLDLRSLKDQLNHTP